MKNAKQRLERFMSKMIFGKKSIKQAQWKQLVGYFRIIGGVIFGSLAVPSYKASAFVAAILWLLLSLLLEWIALRISSNVKD